MKRKTSRTEGSSRTSEGTGPQSHPPQSQGCSIEEMYLEHAERENQHLVIRRRF